MLTLGDQVLEEVFSQDYHNGNPIDNIKLSIQ